MAEVVLIAGAAVGGPLVAQAYSDLTNFVKDAVLQMVWCKNYCQELKEDLDMHQPMFHEICNNLQDPPCEWEQRFLKRFKETLEEGRSLVESGLQLRCWNLIHRFHYSRAILKLRQDILQLFQDLPALSMLQLQKLKAGLQDVGKQRDKVNEEAIGAFKNGNHVERLRKHGLDELIPEDQFLVGLDSRINEVKSLLLSPSEEKKVVMIVGGMGGIGKTTLATAICNDPEVRGFFENQIHFFTVSQSPNMEGLLSSIWEKVVGGKAPYFQNQEDAYRQVKAKLLSMPSNRRLLVLDDVWRKANLENLLFEREGWKTMITTRQAPTLKIDHGHTYTVGLLSKEDAHRLFCYSAFKQDSIPPWVKEPLVVEEVILECNCLPLALKVIGASLKTHEWIPIAWRNARDKLRAARPLDDYHKDVLQGRLQTSIDALDATLQECFLDLGAFPEDSKCSADALLDVWVYVRGMERMDAVLALVELGDRCLLDFDKKVTSADIEHAVESSSASDLDFSQHDVMRDLALHLGRKGRLLMPQKGENIPKDWQSSQAPLAAQLISINTGGMMEQDWPPTLAFPSAEALLLTTDGSNYALPPFIQSMHKLKVISITSRNIGSISGSLEGLSQLQSIQVRYIADGRHFTLGSLGNMHKLEKLQLDSRSPLEPVLFWGIILEGLSKLQHLEILQAPSFTHDVLPHNFGQLGALKKLFLYRWWNLRELPDNFGNLSNLKKLDLGCCTKLEHLPESFGGLSCLKDLYLGMCSKLKHLPESLGGLSCLEHLDLGECSGLKHLPKSFGGLSSLKHLNLGVCRGLEHLPESFGGLSCLENLKLEWCSGLEHLPESFGGLSCLKHLDLQHCSILKHLPESFGLLSCLKHLNLEGCRGLEHLPESFGGLSCLKNLDLEGCRGLEHLPESFGGLSCLEHLDFRHCSKLKHLPESFGGLSCLKHLDLQDCSGLEHLPESFGGLSCLKHLDLQDCSGLEHLPESFGGLSCLEDLDLVCCRKLKHLPESFGGLSRLKHLNLEGCSGLEHLPESFGGLSCLEYLILGGCSRLEHLPHSFGGLSCLEHLDLQDCSKLKHLPESFRQLNRLRTFIPHQNGFQSLPASVHEGHRASLESEFDESLVHQRNALVILVSPF